MPQILGEILNAALAGVTTGLYPIGLVIVAALFTYAITVETSGIATIRSGFSKISDDARVMALSGLVTFLFVQHLAASAT